MLSLGEEKNKKTRNRHHLPTASLSSSFTLLYIKEKRATFLAPCVLKRMCLVTHFFNGIDVEQNLLRFPPPITLWNDATDAIV